MNQSMMLKVAIAGHALTVLGAAVCGLLNATGLAISFLALAVASGFAVLLLYIKRQATREARRALEHRNLLRARNAEPKVLGSDATAQISKLISRLEARVAAPSAAGPVLQQKESYQVKLSSASAPAEPASTVLTIGCAPDVAVPGYATVAVFPGQVTAAFSMGKVEGVLVDEGGFARGAWKSFGESMDRAIVTQLEATISMCERSSIPLVVIRAEETPEHLKVARFGGSVIDSASRLGPATFVPAP